VIFFSDREQLVHICLLSADYNAYFAEMYDTNGVTCWTRCGNINSFPYNWSWKTSLLLGGLLSATDPVAVVALLKELGASKKLSTIIEGESLMNDG
jgi:NhaP-type Na+/H+ and K+/H+ antiporter